jgi:replicative DNA helicase
MEQNKKLSIDYDLFEYIIAYNCLTNEQYLSRVVDAINPQYLNNYDVRIFVDILVEFFRRRNCLPTTTEIKVYLTTPEMKQSVKSVLSKLKTLDTKYDFTELICNTEKFLQEKAVYCAVKQTIDQYSINANINTKDTFTLFENAFNISLMDNIGHDYFNDVDKHIDDINTIEKYISTGYEWFDDYLGGGWMENGRALYLATGSTNSGKSIFLGNFAVKLIEQNIPVVIFTMEMSEMVYAKRISSQLSSIYLKKLKEESEQLKDFIHSFKNKNKSSDLFIKEYSPRSVNTNNLAGYIKQLQQRKKVKPKAIIIDYINLLSPIVSTGNTYVDVKLTAEHTRALSYPFECPVISATQLNRSSYGEQNPGLETTSESIGTAETADMQFSVWSDEAEKELGIINVGMQKNRFGKNHGKASFKIDYNTLAVSEIPDAFAITPENTKIKSSLESLMS